MAKKKKVFIAMDEEAQQAFYERRFGTVWQPGLMMTVQRRVDAGTVKTVPINSRLVGVPVDIQLLEDLVKEFREWKRSRGKTRKELREWVLAGGEHKAATTT